MNKIAILAAGVGAIYLYAKRASAGGSVTPGVGAPISGLGGTGGSYAAPGATHSLRAVAFAVAGENTVATPNPDQSFKGVQGAGATGGGGRAMTFNDVLFSEYRDGKYGSVQQIVDNFHLTAADIKTRFGIDDAGVAAVQANGINLY